MKFLVIVLMLFSTLVARDISKSEMTNLTRTYGFYLGQAYSLESIEKKHPKLANMAFKAKQDFDTTFLSSVNNIKDILRKKGILKFLNSKTISKSLKPQFTYNEASHFIDTVEKRAKGDLEKPVLKTLLAYNPTYEKYPHEEFSDGFKTKYKNDGSGKAQGIRFSIEIPKSWKIADGQRPHVVKKFLKSNKTEFASVGVLVFDAPKAKGITLDNYKQLISKEDMKNSVPKNAVLIDDDYTVLEQTPGYWQHVVYKMQRARKTATIEYLMYTLFYNDKMIHIQFVASDAKTNVTKKVYKKYEPLFDMIINSFILENRY